MKAIMNKEIVEVNIKAQLEQLIGEYHASQQSLADSVRALNQKYKEDVRANTYTPEYLISIYAENKDTLLNAAAVKAKALNTTARGMVAALTGKAVPALSASEKPADYAVRISNALQFIQLEGAAISDETAAQILRDFTGDMEIMQRFRSVKSRSRPVTGRSRMSTATRLSRRPSASFSNMRSSATLWQSFRKWPIRSLSASCPRQRPNTCTVLRSPCRLTAICSL